MNEWYAFDKLCESRYSFSQLKLRYCIAERELEKTKFAEKISELLDQLMEVEEKFDKLTDELDRYLMGEEDDEE